MDRKDWLKRIEPLDEVSWRIPKSVDSSMRVDGLLFLDRPLLEKAIDDNGLQQVVNVASLPGIQKASLAMPDIHWGYGFPIGGVAATDPAEGGVISPGGVGYDINCGVRLLRSRLTADEVRPDLETLMTRLHRGVPSGVGQRGPYKFAGADMERLLGRGVQFLHELGFATDDDLLCCESGGQLDGAIPDYLTSRARERGEKQCGTLGAGNHFLELGRVERIEEPEAARVMGLSLGQLTVMIHSGSRGLGHQVCDDTLKDFRTTAAKYKISLPDRQLACAPIESDEGRRYFGAMCSAANFAWANRQLLTHQVREVFADWAGAPWESLGLELVYDVAHNIAKMEKHSIDGHKKTVCVHRKGATRAFEAGHGELPECYQGIGQPVIIPGDMGRGSWVLVAGPEAARRTFGSCCHGAGRVMSRTKAIREARGRNIDRELAAEGVIARCRSWKGLAEEQPGAYKDVDQVVDLVRRAGLAKPVARIRPIGVVKG
jgi:tRNA-splicing ligase RtcB (3'-phosphate/5'-hydroxy nucleic acid ligase)